MEGIFVTAIDTDIGKTVLCAGLLKLLQGTRDVIYWKPVQTGTILADDTKEVRELTGLGDTYFAEPSYRFADPVAPNLAAKKWGKEIEMSTLVEKYRSLSGQGKFCVVEGAGGLLVPLTDKTLQIEFIKALGIPILLVAEDRLGAINQTLLSLNAARQAGIPILGIIMNRMRGIYGNSESIEKFGRAEILAQFQPREDKRALVADIATNERLRRLFDVPLIPNI